MHLIARYFFDVCITSVHSFICVCVCVYVRGVCLVVPCTVLYCFRGYMARICIAVALGMLQAYAVQLLCKWIVFVCVYSLEYLLFKPVTLVCVLDSRRGTARRG